MASKSINILIKVKESGKNVIPSLNKSFQRLNLTSKAYHETLRSVNGTVRTFTDSLKAMGAALLIGKGLKDSIAAFAGFESALTDMGKVTSESMDSIKSKILALPPALGSATQLMRGYYQVISAGVKDPAKALQTLVVASKAAKAAHVDQAEVIKGLTKIMAGYEGQVKDAAEAADLLFTIEKEGQTTVAELIPYIGGLAKLSHDLGISQNEMAAALAQVTQTAGDTSEAAVQYQGVLQGLMKPSEAMKKTLKSMGFESAQAAIQSLGLVGTLKALKESTGGSAQKMAALFGNIRGLKGMLALSIGDFEALNKKIEEMGKKTGAMDRAWKKYKGTLTALWDTFKNTIGKMAIQFGSELAPSLKKALESINAAFEKNNTKIVQVVKDFGRGIGDVVKGAIAFAGKMSAILRPLSSLGGGMARLLPKLVAALALFKGLKVALGLLIGMPLSIYREILALSSALKVLTAGNLILTYAKHVQVAATYTKFWTVATASLGNAFTVLGASIVSAFAGWEIGKLISEFDAFGLLPMKIKYYVQLAYAYIDEFITKVKLAFSKLGKALAGVIPGAGLLGFKANKGYQKELEDHLKQIERTKKEIIEEGRAESQTKKAIEDKTRATVDSVSAEKEHEAATRANTEAMKAQQEAMATYKDAVNSIGASYDELRQKANDCFDFAVREAQALAESEAAGKDVTLEIYRQKTELVIQLAQQEADAKLKALQQSQVDEARAAQARAQIAENLKNAKIRALKEWRDKLKEAINDSYNQEKRIADKIKGLQDSLVRARQSAADRIRELNRSLMSEGEAWQDKRRQALETLSKAEEKMWSDSAEGLQEAIQLAKKAQDQYAGLAGEVREGDKVIVSQAQSVKEATDGIKLAERILEVATKRQIEMQKQNLQAVQEKAKEQRKQFDDITKKLNELDNKVVHPTVDFKPDTRAVDEAIRRLQRTTHSTHIIHVREVKESRWGGLMSSGGKLPGWGGGDRIRALLEAGEFVIRKEAVRKYGAAFFDALNNMRLDVSRFLSPGLSKIPSAPKVAFAEGGLVKPTERLELNLRVGDIEAPITVTDADSRAAIKEMFRELSKMGLAYA